MSVTDVMHYFHGDGLAMQFEAGSKIGGYYSCVVCDSYTAWFDVLAFCFRAHRQTVEECQDFVLKCEAWKHTPDQPTHAAT